MDGNTEKGSSDSEIDDICEMLNVRSTKRKKTMPSGDSKRRRVVENIVSKPDHLISKEDILSADVIIPVSSELPQPECIFQIIEVPESCENKVSVSLVTNNASDTKSNDNCVVLETNDCLVASHDPLTSLKSTVDDSIQIPASELDSMEPIINDVSNVPKSHPQNAQEPQPSTSKVAILSNVLVGPPFHGNLLESRQRQNKATKNPKTWQRNKNKESRLKGEAYLGFRRDRKVKNQEKFKMKNDVFRPARRMNPACTSKFCKKSKLRCCDTISQEERGTLFHNFWKCMTWDQRRQYIRSQVLAGPKKVTKSSSTTNAEPRRKHTKNYFFIVNNERKQICKKMFLNTLGIKDWFVRYWLDNSSKDHGIAPKTECSRNVHTSPKKKDALQIINSFFDALPKMPSHYARKSSTKEYLEPVFRTMSDLYRVYESYVDDRGLVMSRRSFDLAFMKKNLSLFTLKKDQCDLCCGFKAKQVSEEEHQKHMVQKDRAREEKEVDKVKAINGECHVLTQDLQAVKLAPMLEASAIYYKTKLCVHDFTIYNLATHDVVCYWFDETQATLEASVYASCIVDYLSALLDTKLLPVTIFSDGCCAQNRNVYLSNALLRLSIEKGVKITQKYLVKGHTYMEVDSCHSAIECKLKGQEIYLPSQYVAITKMARTKPMPYNTKHLDFTFFTDFSQNSELIYPSIRPGKVKDDPVVTDLRMLEYRPDGTIWFKLDFDDELKKLPQRPKNYKNLTPLRSLPKLFTACTPITERKFKDLQDLKKVLPTDCHSFYDNLSYNHRSL